MFEIINLVTGELEETGFDTYEDAQRYFEQQGYNMETYGIEGPSEEWDDDFPLNGLDDPSYMY